MKRSLLAGAVFIFAAPDAHAASIEVIEVAILTGARPTSVAILEGGCRVTELAADLRTITARKKTVRVCAGASECHEAKSIAIACADPVVLKARGMAKPVAYGRALSATSAGRRLRLVASVEVEQYVASVVAKELGGAPLEAKKSQAILARTFAARAVLEPRHESAPVCDGQHCQVFGGVHHTRHAPAIDETPASATLSEILVDADEKPTPVFFHSTCGGHTIGATDLWPGASAPAVVGVSDLDASGHAYCQKSPHHEWRHTLTAAELAALVRPLVERALDPASLRLSPEDPDGIVWRIGDKAGIRRVPGARLHQTLGRSLGYTAVRSTRFTVRKRGKELTLTGSGMGHLVGLCQTGAIGRAQAGQTAHEILKAYFPKLTLKTQ